ncbi:MAG: sel1 repeat family protein [Rhodobacteraceae bacterium]|nr:sel1 repeat family protein [Paracoccaceae bacterium]
MAKNLYALIFSAALAFAILPAAPSWGDARSDLDTAEKSFQAGDYANTLKLVRPLAEAGNAEAQRNLGVMYRTGRGVDKDIAAAIDWYRKSADQGFADAQFQLGVIYANGEGVEKDLDQARTWMTKAAAGGMLDAQRYLGEEAITNGDVAGGIAQLTAVADKGLVIGMLDLAQALRDRAMKADVNDKAALADLAEAYKWIHVGLAAVASGPGRDNVHRLRREIENLYTERDPSGAARAFQSAKSAADDKVKELRESAAAAATP